jgi:hypothetical protein
MRWYLKAGLSWRYAMVGRGSYLAVTFVIRVLVGSVLDCVTILVVDGVGFDDCVGLGGSVVGRVVDDIGIGR